MATSAAIAITGGIASGKSTILNLLKSMGARVISADAVAATVFSMPHVNSQLAEMVGIEAPIRPDQLRFALNTDPHLRREVNQLMHGLVMDAIFAEQADFVEVPLLIEVCLQDRFSEVWVVTVEPEIQLARLRARYPDEDVQKILATQLDLRAKTCFADSVLPGNESEAKTRDILVKDVKRVGLPLVV